jgi:hypothetical protein
MKRSLQVVLAVVGLWIILGATTRADVFRVTSPDHEQTFAFGTEQRRAWGERGPDRHLLLYLNYTNDPFVDRINPREYDNFTFSFPTITRAKDGHTFTYRAPNGRIIPVADKHPSFLGIDQIRLLPNANLIVRKPHGFLTVVLEIED